ncbi:hypothetical protein T03_10465 [Trichinella britovi]|uniref:Uncharacterized protein n=1 Tax=Trichinella britovi TaxID=45882 RepID=A0A0V1CCE5_TRIBR|nr:hypothetical protein T03_10465 [Trichinella britovi]
MEILAKFHVFLSKFDYTLVMVWLCVSNVILHRKEHFLMPISQTVQSNFCSLMVNAATGCISAGWHERQSVCLSGGSNRGRGLSTVGLSRPETLPPKRPAGLEFGSLHSGRNLS